MRVRLFTIVLIVLVALLGFCRFAPFSSGVRALSRVTATPDDVSTQDAPQHQQHQRFATPQDGGGLTVHARVLDALTGTEIRDAAVFAEVGGERFESQAGLNTILLPAPGNSAVRLVFPGSREYEAVQLDITSPLSETRAAQFDLRASRRHVIYGQLVAQCDASLAAANIAGVAWPAGLGPMDSARIELALGRTDEATGYLLIANSKDGWYEIDVREPGPYRIAFGGEGWALGAERLSIEVNGATRFDVPMVHLHGAILRAQDDDSGEPLVWMPNASILSRYSGISTSYPPNVTPYDPTSPSAFLAGIAHSEMIDGSSYGAIALFSVAGPESAIRELRATVYAPGYFDHSVQVPVHPVSSGLSVTNLRIKRQVSGFGQIDLVLKEFVADLMVQPTVLVPGCVMALYPKSNDGHPILLRLEEHVAGVFAFPRIPVGRYAVRIKGPDRSSLSMRPGPATPGEDLRVIEVDVSEERRVAVDLQHLAFAAVDVLLTHADGRPFEGQVDFLVKNNPAPAARRQPWQQVTMKEPPYKLVFSGSGKAALGVNVSGVIVTEPEDVYYVDYSGDSRCELKIQLSVQ